MTARLRSLMSGTWLTGPILGKELRMASRRRRHYVVRFLYLIVLVVMIALFWLEVGNHHYNAVNYMNQMARIGRSMTLMIEWFQFLLCPIIAGVMLSTAISDEVYHKTLGVLMTTPISSLQIVMGKLLGKLLQMLLLMAMSLPLLAVIRVFGGIPWMFLVSGFCLTLCLVLLAGSLALWLSISQRRAYVVIIQAVLCFAFAFGLVPFLSFLFGHRVVGAQTLQRFFMVTNPYFCMAGCTEHLMMPGGMGVAQHKDWLVQCGLLLLGTLLFAAWATVRVRRVALQQIAGGAVTTPRRARRAQAKAAEVSTKDLRTVKGCPVLWKDLRAPVLGRKRWKKIVTALATLLLVVAIYVRIGLEGDWDHAGPHLFFVIVYALLGTLFSIIIPATLITREKESRSWPILLGTSLTEGRILWSKALAALRWCLPRWGLWFGHVLLFVVVGFIHPVALALLVFPASGIVFLVVGTGLYWSVRLRRTTTAVIANFSVPLLLWGIVPLLWSILVGITHGDENLLENYLNLHPFVQMGCVIDALSDGRHSSIRFVQGGRYTWGEAAFFMGVSNLLWAGIGLIFAGRSRFLLRKKIF